MVMMRIMMLIIDHSDMNVIEFSRPARVVKIRIRKLSKKDGSIGSGFVIAVVNLLSALTLAPATTILRKAWTQSKQKTILVPCG